MRGKVTAVEQATARIASRQYGVITRRQLVGAGMRDAAIDRRMANGLLIPEFRAVYRFAHSPPGTAATYMAAVLAGGKGALLAGRAAAHWMKLLRGAPPPPEVITPNKSLISGIRRCNNIDRRDVAKYLAIPCTTVPRTLVDLAATLSESDLSRAFHEASVIHGTRPEHVEAVLARRPRVKGAGKLRRVLRGDTKLTLSKLEKRFLELLKENNLELPETNKRVGGRYVDCRWPKPKLTIELDSYRYHRTRHAWEQDRKREREARKRGDDFRRFTWGDVFEDPRGMLDELRPILCA